MDGSEIAVGVGKGGVNLNGTSVALECSIYVLHLLQCVPHVAVGISKVGMDPTEREREREREMNFSVLSVDSLPNSINTSHC